MPRQATLKALAVVPITAAMVMVGLVTEIVDHIVMEILESVSAC